MKDKQQAAQSLQEEQIRQALNTQHLADSLEAPAWQSQWVQENRETPN